MQIKILQFAIVSQYNRIRLRPKSERTRMYRLLFISMLFWPLSFCALAQETGGREPLPLQRDQGHARPIEQANSHPSLGFDGNPASFQSPARHATASSSTPTRASAETPLAPHRGSSPAADSTNIIQAGGSTAPQSRSPRRAGRGSHSVGKRHELNQVPVGVGDGEDPTSPALVFR